jgi:hypothetical protein
MTLRSVAIVLLVVCVDALIGAEPTCSESQTVPVSAVFGMHSGRCSKACWPRFAAAIASLTRRDLAWRNHCSCMYLSAPQVVAQYRVDSRTAKYEHLIHIVLAHPIELPLEGKPTHLDRPVLDVIAAVFPVKGYPLHTELWLGHRQPTTGKTLYEAFLIPGDPFGIAHWECDEQAMKGEE